MFIMIMQFLFILLITVPFLYMVFDVTVDVLKRFYGFYKNNAKPVVIKIRETQNRF